MFSNQEFATISYLRFMSMTNFMHSWVKHEKKLSNLGARVLFVRLQNQNLL